MSNKIATKRQLVTENKRLRDQLNNAETSLREIHSGEADAFFVSGAAGAEIFAIKGADQAYRTIIEKMGQGTLTLTPNGLVLYANHCFAEMLRIPLEKVMGSEIFSWFAPESRQLLQTLLLEDMPDKHNEELVLTAIDGTQVPVYLSVNHLILEGIDPVCIMVVTDLTRQKRNEAILAEQKLAGAILEQAPDAILICNDSGHIIRASKQAQMFSDKNLIGQLFVQAFPLRHLDGSDVYHDSDTIVSDCKLLEVRLEHNAKEFSFLINIGHLKDAQTKLLGSVVTLIDITGRNQAELALQTSEEFSRNMFVQAPLGIAVIDSFTGQFYKVNPRFAVIAGRTTEEMENIDWLQITHPDDIQEDLDNMALLNAGKINGFQMEKRYLHPNGTVVWIDMTISQLKTNDNISRHLCMIQDITERKQTEKTRDQLANILESTTDLVITGDPTGHIMYLNHTAYTTLGLDPEEDITQMKVADFISNPDENSGLTEGVPIAIKKGSWSGDTVLKTLSGQKIPVSQVILAHRDSGGEIDYFSTIIRDISEQKRSESSIKYLNRVLSVMSGINTLSMRANNHDELFRNACDIAVEDGGFCMAIIVVVEPSTKLPVSVTLAGKDKKLLAITKNRMSTNESMQKTLVARAIGEKKTIISNDTQKDTRMIFSKQYTAAGVNSMTVLPLIISGEAIGAIAFYASEINFFQVKEMNLLTELADDIAYAIDHIDKQERLNYLAYYDVLTGLANRRQFFDRAEQYIHSAVSGSHKLAICLIDLERFKNINDCLGRPAGNSLLRQVAKLLEHETEDACLLGRFGADLFALLVPEVKSDSYLAKLIEELITTFQKHSFCLNDRTFRIGIKVGAVLFPDDGDDPGILLNNAEAVLNKAKESGEQYLFYKQEINEAVTGNLVLENQLRQAIDNEEFVLHYQPKINLVSGKVIGAEALIRWNDPRTGLVPPGVFIPILELTGLINKVGRWALHQAITDYLRWRDAGLPVVRIAVNVSPLQLHSPDFVAEIEREIRIDEHAAAGLELEITESLIMKNVINSINSLQKIRDMGISIGIDDFGTGFSSLSYLSKLPIDTLKIDRAFVLNMNTSEGVSLVSTIIILAHALKLKVVAEGVETEQQSRQLLSLNCDEMQGFLFSKPVPAEIFEARFLAPITAR